MAGFGWMDQYDSYLTETYAAIGVFHLLGETIPDADAVEAYVRIAHPINGPNSETRKHWAQPKEFSCQEIQTLHWLGRPTDTFRKRVESWTTVSTYTPGYEAGANPVLRFEAQPALCRRLLGLSCEPISAAFKPYFALRRRDNGTYNTTPAADGSDGHLVNTYYALAALQAMGEEPDRAVGGWVRNCQLPDGGFSWQPNAPVGNVSDLSYALAAARILAMLGQEPNDGPGLTRWLQSLANDDGGFSDRPGAPSSALATFQVLETCRLLDISLTAKRIAPTDNKTDIPAELRVYCIQFEAPRLRLDD